MLFFLLGCTSSLKMAGEDLNPPASMIYGHSVEQRLMIVLSDLPSLCAELQGGDVPRGSWWTLSIWTHNRVVEPGLYSAQAYFRQADGSSAATDTAEDVPTGDAPEESGIVLSEHTTDAAIDLFNIISLDDEDQARGTYEATFSESILEGRFQVQPCEGVYLFAGMEE
ncbi:MAG: hypothetical protein CMK59_02775 [Proteobacteria bacterium]|nr:hypothetical protein [Pseudomonadota bacterium]